MCMEPLTAARIANLSGGRVVMGDAHAEATGVTLDHRQLKPGNLFIALPGRRVDGHQFVTAAFRSGAAGALVREAWLQERETQPLLAELRQQSSGFLVSVPDTLTGFHQLAAGYRRLFQIPVIGVTGSNGKTTTKDLIYSILRQAGPTLRTEKNLNTEYGVPLTLLALEASHRWAVLEMGMRGLGQIALLARLAAPSIGVVTNVGPVHLELLGSLENIALAKGELVEALPAEGFAVLNADDPWVRAMASRTRARVLEYGLQEGELRAERVDSRGPAGLELQVVWRGEARVLSVPLVGRHNAYNVLAAVGACLALGVSWETIAAGLAAPALTGMRLQVQPLPGGGWLIDDAYNASPASMRAALAVVAELAAQGGRSVAVLGEMLELGPLREEAHRQLGQEVAQRGIDWLVAVGDGGRLIAEAAEAAGLPRERCWWVNDAAQAAVVVPPHLQPGDVILVKASRGIRLEQVVEAVRQRWLPGVGPEPAGGTG